MYTRGELLGKFKDFETIFLDWMESKFENKLA